MAKGLGKGWHGTRPVGVPSPPYSGGNVKLTEKGNTLKKKVQDNKKALRAKALKSPILVIGNNDLIDKLDKKTLRDIAIEVPWAAFQDGYLIGKLDKKTLRDIAIEAPYAAIRFASGHFDNKFINDLAFASADAMDAALHFAINKLTPKTLGAITKTVFPIVYKTSSKHSYKEIRERLFNRWVYGYTGFVAKQFRDNVVDIFKLKNTSKASERIVGFSERTKKVIIDLYKETQALLKKDYPLGKVTLYRGIDRKIDIPYGFNSFSINKDTAKSFDGHEIIEVDVPIKNILSYPKSGSITTFSKEQEFIVMGNYKDFKKIK